MCGNIERRRRHGSSKTQQTFASNIYEPTKSMKFQVFNTYKHTGLLKRCLEHRKTFAILEIGGKVASGFFKRHLPLHKK